MAGERFAAIDIGTNTILLLIAELSGSGAFSVLEDRAEITRLGEGVDRARVISSAAAERALRTLRAYRERCRELEVDEIVAVGTSALREARNAVGFRDRLRRETGVEVRVLSAEEEAGYSYLAVERGLGLKETEVLAVDIGGGSTEFIWSRGSGPDRWASLDLGSVRLTERYLPSDPPAHDECVRLKLAIDRELEALMRGGRVVARAPVMVGIAGTFTTLAAVAKGLAAYSHAEVHGARLSEREVARQVELYRSLPLAARRAVPGLEPGRADVILAGAVLVGRIMSLFGISSTLVSGQGIRYGLLYERL